MLPAVVLAAALRQQLAPAAGAFGRAGPKLRRGQIPVGIRHPCPLPFGPTGLADGLALEDALSGTVSAIRPGAARQPPNWFPRSGALGGHPDSALDLRGAA